MNEFALIPGTLPAALNSYPATPQQLMERLCQYMSVQFSETLAFFNFGETTPPPDRQDRPWFRTLAGKPYGVWVFYNGQWIRDWGVPVGVQMSIYDLAAPAFDGTGLATDPGYVGWALCNGNNGTDDMRDRFILGYKDFATAPEGDTGGSKTKTLVEANVPPHQHPNGSATDADASAGVHVYGSTTEGMPGQATRKHGEFGTNNITTQGFTGPNRDTAATPFDIMPPHIVKAFIQYIGV